MIDRIRTVVVDEILSPLRRYLATGTMNETSNDCPYSDPPGPPRKQPPEDHVLDLLEARGGRLWQQTIVAESEYSEPHVSRLLCRMEDENLVERHWMRGQKVVVLPEESIGVASSVPATSA